MQYSPSALSLYEAARVLAADPAEVPAMEMRLAQAIEHGTLHANIKRWATEQWEGERLPGNINRLETTIEKEELQRWFAAATAA